MTIGILHPGRMGASVGAALVAAGQEVLWSPAGRSGDTAGRAERAGFARAAGLADLGSRSELVLSVCPPHAAEQVATELAAVAAGPPGWLYLDANAVAPATAARVAAVVGAAGARYVDGGIVGPPPDRAGTTRLYLSGPDALVASETLATPLLEVHCLGDESYAASALKLAYAAWSKGAAALVLAAREAAVRAGVEGALIEEWNLSQAGLEERWAAARSSAAEKGWRWSGEMAEVAAMFESLGLPGGFHRAAASVFDEAHEERGGHGSP